MNKFSRTARSVTFAAIVGLSMGVTAPAALAQESPSSQLLNANSIINPNTAARLTIHKFANPTANPLQDPTGTGSDAEREGLGEKLDGVGFTIYKIKDVDLTTNEGLAKAANLKVSDYVKSDGSADTTKVEQVGKEQFTSAGQTTFEIGTNHGAYLVVETTPKEGFTPAVPFIAYVPMTAGNGANEGQGTEWNYDVHAVPKNYSKKEPTKSVKDQDDNKKLDNVGDVIDYTIDTQTRNIAEGKRLQYYFVGDTLDKQNFDVNEAKIKVEIKKKGAEAYAAVQEGTDYSITRDADSNSFRVNFTQEGLKKLGSNTDVRVSVAVTKNSNDPIAPNQATEWEPSNPTSDQDVDGGDTPPNTPPEGDKGRKSNVVQTRFGEVEFTKVDSQGKELTGAEFKLYQTLPGQKCETVDVKAIQENQDPATGFAVKAFDAADNKVDDVFNTNDQGVVNISGLHVNDFANNADVPQDQQTTYCLVETKAPKGKELLSKAIPFQLLKSDQTKQVVVPQETTTWTTTPEGKVEDLVVTEGTTNIDVPVYDKQFVQVGDFEKKVVNIDDTTPNLPMTGGAGVGILAAIGAAIVAAGAWFARRGAKN